MIVSLICSTQPRWVPNTKALAWTCLCLMKQHFCIKLSWKISWPQMSTQGVAISTECALGMCSVFLINHNFQHNAKNHARKESVPKRSTCSSYTDRTCFMDIWNAPVCSQPGSWLRGIEPRPSGYLIAMNCWAQLTCCGTRKLADINKYCLFPFQCDLK